MQKASDSTYLVDIFENKGNKGTSRQAVDLIFD